MKRFKKEEVKSQVVSDFGMTAELYIEACQNIDYPLFKVYADEETEEKYVELSSGNKVIQIPLESLQDFLSFADKEVHSESWYDKNVFNQE
ncbi:hypothetical protein [Gynuella sunshinyii]|uniref:Uncharacterized protein n=1 Tax=Gynuella sunshinyii YC6258 TaxID=1445510 RepID=A0A0C5VJ16_9GAMM|nr:hypothetical protein [Gynuella sunshinyii]AJQ93378.1 hypothetical Protein YC6258_01330 [Gynuella sunshinyii YC6258]